MKVVVAIDDRPSSQATLDALVKMHWHQGTEIHLVTVVATGSDDRKTDAEPTTFDEMESLAAELRKALGQCEISCFAETGDAKTVILELAEQIQADLIVLGSNCKSTLERLLLGSVCQTVLNGAQCPVIVAKTPCCLAREAAPGFKNILVPIDNSIFSDAAVQWLANFSWAPETRFIVVAVVAEDTDLTQVKQSLEKRTWNLSRLLETNNITIETVIGEPHQGILNLAKKYYADLIVMGSHGRTGLKEKILGTCSHAVTHDAPCAVAIVRGIASDDPSRHGTGAFRKVTPPVTQKAERSYRRDESEISVHTMPAGFGF